jgi:membrane-associated phospholipid phosphatase
VRAILYDWGGLNLWLFHAINDLRGGVLEPFMQAGTALGDHDRFPLYIALLTIAGWWRLAPRSDVPSIPVVERTTPWLLAFATFTVAYFVDGLLVSWLKHALDFPRPPLALPPGTLHVVGEPRFHHSLPSGHATFAISVAASLWSLAARRARIVLVAFVLWVDLSRINLGMHFPADVLAGNLLGLAVVVGTRLTLLSVTRPAAF